ALKADSSFGPAYRTGVGLTLSLKGRDSALALLRRYLKINPADSMMAALGEVLSGHLSDVELRNASDKWPIVATRNAAFILAAWPESSAAGARWLKILAERSAISVNFLGAALRFRGRIAEASQLPDSSFRYSPAGATELLFASRLSGAEGAKL